MQHKICLIVKRFTKHTFFIDEKLWRKRICDKIPSEGEKCIPLIPVASALHKPELSDVYMAPRHFGGCPCEAGLICDKEQKVCQKMRTQNISA